jgi:protein TonB
VLDAPASVDVPGAGGSVAAARGETLLPDGYLDAVRGYRIAVATQAKRFRRYPPAAREMGIGGRSEIEIVVAVANSPEFLVRRSSGHQELDRAALEMLRRSVDLVELPALLRGRRLSITLPVEFLPPP